MATIRKRGDSYFVEIRKRKAAPIRKSFTRKSDAVAWAAKVETDLNEGRAFPWREARRHTLDQLIDRYLEEYTFAGRQAHLKWFADEKDAAGRRFGDRLLCDITTADLTELKIRLKNRPTRFQRGRAPATVNRYLASLAHAYSVAVREWQWLEHSPLPNVARLAEPRGRARFLSDDEREALLNACQNSPDRFIYVFVVLALSTGARAGELLSLGWQDLDLKAGRGVLHHTKNGERRALAVKGKALELLSNLSKIRRIDTRAVFPDWHYRDPWDQVVAQAKLEDFRFHDLRHSAASYLAMDGASLAEIAGVLGHKTLAMVKRYSHLSDDHIAGAVEKMNAKIFGAAK